MRLRRAAVLVRLWLQVEEDWMSESQRSEGGVWLDRWWQLLVILFGLIFVAILVSYNPAW